MTIPRYTFKDSILLFNLGDAHRGDPAHDNQLFLKVVNAIRHTNNAYWISTGDLLNVALQGSKSDVYNSANLEQEFEWLIKDVSPIADRCLGMVASNHHNRFDRAVGMSLDKLIAGKLNIPFLGQLGLLNITCDKASYYVAMHHGIGSGKRRGAKTNNAQDLASIIPGADIYLEGHTHTFDHFIDESVYIDRKRGKLSHAKAWFCVTGHFLDYMTSYASSKKYRPAPKGSAFIEIFAAGAGNIWNKKVTADLYY